MGKIEYREEFESENPVTFWTATGKYTVNYAGLSTERSHGGTQSYKLDITFLGGGNYNYWSGPILDIPAVPGARLSGHIYLEQVPPNVQVSLGSSFLLPALTEMGRGEGRGSCVAIGSFSSNSETGTWHRQTSEIKLGAEGMSRTVLGEVTPALHFEKWYIHISCREARDARLVVYIDDIAIEGVDVPEAWRDDEDRRLRVWGEERKAREAARRGRFRAAMDPVHAEAKEIARDLARLSLPGENMGSGWERFAADMLGEARQVIADLVERTGPDVPVPAKDKGLALHVHDLRDQWLQPARWALDNLDPVRKRQAPYLLTVRNDPLTNHRVIPTSRILGGVIDDGIRLFASPGEYEPASFVLAASKPAIVTFEISDLTAGSNTIAAAHLDLKSVKAWYQAGIAQNELDKKILTPELLLNDDSLVRVDLEKQTNTVRDIDHPRDAETLLPVPIPAWEAKQFWLTVRVPETASPGLYRGSILIKLEGIAEHSLPVQFEVLPIQLRESSLLFGLYYRGFLSNSRSPEYVSSELKTEQQMAAEFRNMKEHGILYPDVYQTANLRSDGTLDTDELGRYLDLRDRCGLPRDKLFYNGNSVGVPESEEALAERIDFCGKLLAWARERGIEEVYFYGADEAHGEELIKQRQAWEAVRELGGKMAVACSVGFFDLIGDLLDLPIINGLSPEELPHVHALGHKMVNYSLPQGGIEQPFTYRYFFGHWLLRSGMDGSHTYAYQHGHGPGGSMGRPWDDFDSAIYRPHVFAYPTVDGVVDTLEWEGVREAVDDTRYVATLQAAIAEARGSENQDAVKRADAAEDWLKNVDISGDLLAIRRGMADRIIELNAVAGAP